MKVSFDKSGLDNILRLYSSELFDIVFDTTEKVMRDFLKISFENIALMNQQEVINAINESVKGISNKTKEIVYLFYDLGRKTPF